MLTPSGSDDDDDDKELKTFCSLGQSPFERRGTLRSVQTRQAGSSFLYFDLINTAFGWMRIALHWCWFLLKTNILMGMWL